MMGVVNERAPMSQVTRDGHRCGDDDANFGGVSPPATPSFQTNGDIVILLERSRNTCNRV